MASFLEPWVLQRAWYAKGKELADAIVIFDDAVLIFQDKEIRYGGGDASIAWNRWHKQAVEKQEQQLRVAEQRLFRPGLVLFADPAAKKQLPLRLPLQSRAQVHRIATVHGISERCREVSDGRASLRIRPDLRVDQPSEFECTIGTLNGSNQFVHIWNDHVVDYIFRQFDTARDLVCYLNAKERLFRTRGMKVLESSYLTVPQSRLHIGGEENLVESFLHADSSEGWVIDGFGLIPLQMGGHALEQLDQIVKHSAITQARAAALAVSKKWDDFILGTRKQTGLPVFSFAGPKSIDLEVLARLLAMEDRSSRCVLVDAVDKLGRAQRGTAGQLFGTIINPMLVHNYFVWFPSPEEARRADNLVEAVCWVAIDADKHAGLGGRTTIGLEFIPGGDAWNAKRIAVVRPNDDPTQIGAAADKHTRRRTAPMPS